jgi:hypothetical protein
VAFFSSAHAARPIIDKPISTAEATLTGFTRRDAR